MEERDVTLGPDVDNFVLIKKGLSSGESVVYEGLQKVADGTTVKTKEAKVERITQEQE